MNKIKSNGNGNLKSIAAMEEKIIEFPVSYELKAVMLGSGKDEESMENK